MEEIRHPDIEFSDGPTTQDVAVRAKFWPGPSFWGQLGHKTRGFQRSNLSYFKLWFMKMILNFHNAIQNNYNVIKKDKYSK